MERAHEKMPHEKMPHEKMAHEKMPRGAFSIVHRAGRSARVEVGPTHENPGFELSWIERGAFELALGRRCDRVVAASAGASLLLPPGLLNTPRASTASVQQILISEALVEEAADAIGAAIPSEARAFGVDSSPSSIAKAIWIEARDARAIDPADPVLEALVHALTLSLVRPTIDRRERHVEAGIRRARDRIEAQYAEPLRIDDLARTAGLSRFELLRKFAAQIGESPHRYLTAVRLDRAAELLRSTPRSVLEIALDCGFGDPSRFARAFAKRFGATPRAWRARSA